MTMGYSHSSTKISTQTLVRGPSALQCYIYAEDLPVLPGYSMRASISLPRDEYIGFDFNRL